LFCPFANLASFLYSGKLLDPKSDRPADYEAFSKPVHFKEVMMKTIFTLLAMLAFTSAAVVVPQSSAFAASQYPNKGKVLETMDASIYTYMQVATDKGNVWLAASKTSVPKGATISYPDGAVMTNFTSKSLNRTFDSIIFVDKVKVEKK
jgi:hypothetical protein